MPMFWPAPRALALVAWWMPELWKAVAAICVEAGLIPGCLGLERPDPGFASGIVVANRAARVDRVLSNSFGFGGSNCALVIGRLP